MKLNIGRKVFRTTCAAYLESLAVLRQFVDRTGQQMGLDAQMIDDLRLSVDEASTNIIKHGYRGMNPGSIILELVFSARQVAARLTDFGHPFEPIQSDTSAAGTHTAEHEPGDFGLYYIYSVMDHVDYRTDEDGNTLILTKKLDED